MVSYDDFPAAGRSGGAATTAGRRFRVRLAEALFRRWPFVVVAILAFGAVGVAAASRQTEEYRSVGLLNVADTTLLGDLTSVRGDATFSYETVATRTARSVNELLRTDTFVRDVVDRAGLTASVESGVVTLETVRTSVYASADGDTLLQVIASTSDPEASYRLASATIDGYIAYVLESEVSESEGFEQFFKKRQPALQDAVDAAQEAIDDYLRSHPAPANGADRPIEEQIDLQRLDGTLSAAEDALATNQQKIEDAQLATDTSIAESGQKLKVVDPPSVPDAPESTLKASAFTILVFLVLGTGASLAALVAIALVDRAVRSADDIADDESGLVILASIPELKKLRRASGDPLASAS